MKIIVKIWLLGRLTNIPTKLKFHKLIFRLVILTQNKMTNIKLLLAEEKRKVFYFPKYWYFSRSLKFIKPGRYVLLELC